MSRDGDTQASMLSTAVRCDGCGRDVPLDEAVVPEALTYMAYFCGLDCYARWRAAATAAHIPARPER